METLRTIWNDVRRDLKQTKDDFEIPDKQGWYWTLVVADRLRVQHIVKRRSGAFLSTFVLPVLMDEVFPGRPYVELPVSIYDLDLDAGIESLSYFDNDNGYMPQFTRLILSRTSPSEEASRGLNPYEKACGNNPKFWREGKRLYLLGVDEQHIKAIEAKLYANLPDINDVDPDAVLDFPRELILPLKRALLDMGRFVLALPGEYLTNDGTNRPAQQVIGTPGKTVSVNSPLINTGEDET